MVNLLLILAHLPCLGDFSLQASVDRSRVTTGESILVTATVRGDGGIPLADWPVPAFVTQPDPLVWTLADPATQSSPGMLTKTWRLTPLQTGTWRLPDIACHFARKDIPFQSASQSLRLVGLDPVEVVAAPAPGQDLLADRIQAGALEELPHYLRGLIALARLAWVGPCLVTLVLVLAKWARFPVDPDARRAWWRGWLTGRGLPPGRHTGEGISAFLQARGWKPEAVTRVLTAWDHPVDAKPLPHPEARSLIGWTLAGLLGLIFAAIAVASYLPMDAKNDLARFHQADAAWVSRAQSPTAPSAPAAAEVITTYRELARKSPVQAGIRLQWIDAGKDPLAIPRTLGGPLLTGLAWSLLWVFFLVLDGWGFALVLVIGMLAFPATRPGAHNLFLAQDVQTGETR